MSQKETASHQWTQQALLLGKNIQQHAQELIAKLSHTSALALVQQGNEGFQAKCMWMGVTAELKKGQE